MKILYNHQIFHLKYGGISRYFVELANNIALYKNKEVTITASLLLKKALNFRIGLPHNNQLITIIN